MFLTCFSPFSEVGNDSETYDDEVSDEDDEDDAGENQQNNDLPSNEGVIPFQIPVLQQPAEDTTIIVESSRGRKRQLPGQAHGSNICADEGCEASIEDENELLRCDAPGCRLTVSVLTRLEV